jgi:hypothetical protein
MAMMGDLVLVHHDNKPAFFARMEDINPDHKPGWYQVRLLVLTAPLEEITWILRDAYINGTEFTMGGHPVRLEHIPYPRSGGEGAGEKGGVPLPKEQGDSSKARVVSLFDRRR